MGSPSNSNCFSGDSMEHTYGDMLNILLSLLFPHQQPKPRNHGVSSIICSYNPNVPKIAQKLFKLLEDWGADPQFLEELKRELRESLEADKLDGCAVIYKH